MPKPPCYELCPVIHQDKVGVINGYPQAQEDLDRHSEDSKGCTGIDMVSQRNLVKCPLFGVEAKL